MKRPAVTLPVTKFFDGTLLDHRGGARFDGVFFLDDRRLLVLGRSRTEVVAHLYELDDDGWRWTGRRNALPRKTAPEIGFGGSFFVCEPIVARLDDERFLCVWVGRAEAQSAVLDVRGRTLTDVELEGARGFGQCLEGRTFEGEVGALPIVFTDRTDEVDHAPTRITAPGKPAIEVAVHLKPGVLRWREHLVGCAGSTVYAVDMADGRVARTWDLDLPSVFIRREGDHLVARSPHAQHELVLSWDAPSRTRAPTDPNADDDRVGDLRHGRDPSGKGWQVRNAEDEVLLEVRSKSRVSPAYLRWVSPTGRWWAFCNTLDDFALLERTDAGFRLVPRTHEPTPEQRARLSYPGFTLDARAPLRTKAPLGLALFEALVEAGLAEPFSLSAFALAFPDARVRPERMALVKDAVRCVHVLAEQSPRLAELRTVHHEVNGNALHAELFPHWDGEDETFDVTDLSGIEVASGLCEVSLALGGFEGRVVDVSPLAKLPHLRRLELRGLVKGLEALSRHAGALELIVLDEPPPPAVTAALRASGVEVVVRSASPGATGL